MYDLGDWPSLVMHGANRQLRRLFLGRWRGWSLADQMMHAQLAHVAERHRAKDGGFGPNITIGQ